MHSRQTSSSRLPWLENVNIVIYKRTSRKNENGWNRNIACCLYLITGQLSSRSKTCNQCTVFLLEGLHIVLSIMATYCVCFVCHISEQIYRNNERNIFFRFDVDVKLLWLYCIVFFSVNLLLNRLWMKFFK